MTNRLMALYKANAGRGLPMAAERRSDQVTEIMLYGAIGYPEIEAADFVAELNKVDTPEILLRVNSPGGCVFDGIAMMGALKDHPAKVTARVDGIAASAASFIILAADEIEMGEATRIFTHCAWGMTVGNADDHDSQSSVLRGIDADMAKMYANRTGLSESAWSAYMKAETYFGRDAAISIGLADRATAEKPKAKIEFDLSAYEKPDSPKAETEKTTSTLTLSVDTSQALADLDEVEKKATGIAALFASIFKGKPKEDALDLNEGDVIIEGSRAAALERLKAVSA